MKLTHKKTHETKQSVSAVQKGRENLEGVIKEGCEKIRFNLHVEEQNANRQMQYNGMQGRRNNTSRNGEVKIAWLRLKNIEQNQIFWRVRCI